MPILGVVGLILLVVITGAIGRGTNGAALIAAIIFFPAAIALYCLPAIVAQRRSHINRTGITILNLALGWTLLGWLGALVWSYSAQPAEAAAAAIATPSTGQQRSQTSTQPPTERLCPYCAETVKFAAVKCKHCGSDLPPGEHEAPIKTGQATDQDLMAKHGITFDGTKYWFSTYSYDRLKDAVSYAQKAPRKL
jgi:hypothetical protein